MIYNNYILVKDKNEKFKGSFYIWTSINDVYKDKLYDFYNYCDHLFSSRINNTIWDEDRQFLYFSAYSYGLLTYEKTKQNKTVTIERLKDELGISREDSKKILDLISCYYRANGLYNEILRKDEIKTIIEYDDLKLNIIYTR